ncbi:hypothetical protein VTH06DRAFT_7494 [Thermothelomyces fergusii]
MAATDRAGGDSSTRALRGASLLIALQVVSRAITFVANQALLRFLTAQLLGVSAQLEVYYLSVIFFARESLRVAVQRQDLSGLGDKKDDDGDDDDEDKHAGRSSAQAVVNLGYLALVLGLPLAFLFGRLYLGSLSTSTLQSAPNLVVSLYIYAAAAVLELASEPAFVVMQTRLQFGTRAAGESVATFLRCIVTLGTAAWGAGRDLGVLPFALGQLSYGLGLLAVYTWHGAALARREGFSLLPVRISAPGRATVPPRQPPAKPVFILSYFYRPTVQLASSMMAQSVVKHVLTQGDTFLVSILSSPTDQGVYALANNYGGLVARLVFQPIEESCRSYFGRLLAAADAAAEGTGAPPAFVAAAATAAEVRRQGAWMGAFSAAFAAAAVVFLRGLRWGAAGLVAANAVNMACRIAWCARFVRRYFARRALRLDLLDLLPAPASLLAAAVASQLVRNLVPAPPSGEDAPLGVKEAVVDLAKIASVALPLVFAM